MSSRVRWIVGMGCQGVMHIYAGAGRRRASFSHLQKVGRFLRAGGEMDRGGEGAGKGKVGGFERGRMKNVMKVMAGWVAFVLL